MQTIPQSFTELLRQRHRAFTLIELLTVIAIIGILAAIMIPTLGAVRKSARSTVAMTNIRQMVTAELMYATDNKGMFTPVWGYPDEHGQNRTWQNRLLPYLYPNAEGMTRDERSVYLTTLRASSGFVMDVPEVERVRSDGTDTNLKGVGMNSFLAINNVGVINDGRGRITDVERPGTIILLGEMQDRNSDTMDYAVVAYRRSGHKAYMGFCDGRVRLVTEAELQEQASSKGSLWRWKYGG